MPFGAFWPLRNAQKEATTFLFFFLKTLVTHLVGCQLTLAKIIKTSKVYLKKPSKHLKLFEIIYSIYYKS